MILIIGGAYQGKLEYARRTYHLEQGDIFVCDSRNVDFSRRCIYGIENYVLSCVQTGKDPIEEFTAQKDKWADSVLICQDIFCGVVPLEAENRLWRQQCGRLCQYLSENAGEVIRIFCGLEQKLK